MWATHSFNIALYSSNKWANTPGRKINSCMMFKIGFKAVENSIYHGIGLYYIKEDFTNKNNMMNGINSDMSIVKLHLS